MALPDKGRLLEKVRTRREQWQSDSRPERIDPPGPDQESVWDFPRPPEVQKVREPLRVVFAGEAVADTSRGLRIVETAGAPVYYFPPESVRMEQLGPTDHITICEWKGAAMHYDLIVGGRRSEGAAFCYPDPLDDLRRGYRRVAGWFAFHPGRVDACFVGGEQAMPQRGGYYAGWVTSGIAGPIKGAPGTESW